MLNRHQNILRGLGEDCSMYKISNYCIDSDLRLLVVGEDLSVAMFSFKLVKPAFFHPPFRLFV